MVRLKGEISSILVLLLIIGGVFLASKQAFSVAPCTGGQNPSACASIINFQTSPIDVSPVRSIVGCTTSLSGSDTSIAIVNIPPGYSADPSRSYLSYSPSGSISQLPVNIASIDPAYGANLVGITVSGPTPGVNSVSPPNCANTNYNIKYHVEFSLPSQTTTTTNQAIFASTSTTTTLPGALALPSQSYNPFGPGLSLLQVYIIIVLIVVLVYAFFYKK